MDQTAKFGWKRWLEVILIGFVGQLAWAVENQYINSWIYSQTHSATYITWTTIASAIAATITTLFMGVLSDRLRQAQDFHRRRLCDLGRDRLPLRRDVPS
jgi:MFS family permease